MHNKPIRILQCVSNMDRAGIETMLMNFYRNIDRNEIQFDFLCNKSKPGEYDEEIKKLGGKIYVSPGLNPLKWKKYQKFMKELFDNNPEYKIIHCQNEAMGYPALYAAKKCNIPVRISHSHNTVTRIDLKWPIKILYKFLLKKQATKLVACSKMAGKYLFGKEVDVINNAINSDKFIYNEELRGKLRKQLDIEDKFVIGHVGRFEPQKNHAFLIDLFFEYQKINPKSILMLIGTGTLEKKICNKIKKMGIEKKVLFTGSIPNVNEYYNAMDVFVLPSHHEGLPVVGIEAQCSGLKCIFSDNITTETNITGNIKYLSISSVNPWVGALEEIRNSNYKRVNMKKTMEENNYDIKAATKKISSFYQELHNEK